MNSHWSFFGEALDHFNRLNFLTGLLGYMVSILFAIIAFIIEVLVGRARSILPKST